MRFAQIYSSGEPRISFELFPPRTQGGLKKLKARLPRLAALQPSFLTVTYGAFGTTQGRTLEIASLLKQQWRQETAHHLTCVGATADELDRQLDDIRAAGIENIVALRGDPPEGSDRFQAPAGGYSHACELVEHIRRRGDFGVAVAGYPEKHTEAADFETDLRHLKHKVDCGADVIITQLFYRNRSYYDFVANCRSLGITQPIVAGLMPILDLKQIRRITTMCGSTIPRELLKQLRAAGPDREKVYQIGVDHTARQAIELIESGVAGIHFYVLNRYFHIAEVMERIRPTLSHLNRIKGAKTALS